MQNARVAAAARVPSPGAVVAAGVAAQDLTLGGGVFVGLPGAGGEEPEGEVAQAHGQTPQIEADNYDSERPLLRDVDVSGGRL